MPTTEEHVHKAEDNERFAASIQPESQVKIDWRLVMLFYAAVHYVEAYLAKPLGMHVRTHTTRDSYMGKESNVKKVFRSYGHLKFFGYNARYEVSGFTAAQTEEAEKYLEDIRSHIKPLL